MENETQTTKTTIDTFFTIEGAKELVEKKEAKFLSYGHDQSFFLIKDGNVYAHREKTYTLLGGDKL